MARKFRCSVCGMEITGDSEDEVLRKAVQHAKEKHGMEDNEETRRKLRSQITVEESQA